MKRFFSLSNWSELISHFLLFDSPQSDRHAEPFDAAQDKLCRSTNHEINFVPVLNSDNL